MMKPAIAGWCKRAALAWLVCLFAACDGSTPSTTTESRSYPSSEATKTVTVFLTGSVVTTRVRSARIVSFADRDSSWAYLLHVDFYDPSGEHTSALWADSALIREKARLLEGYGNVRIVTDDHRTLASPHLVWDDQKRKIATDSLVTITRGDDTMSGYGFLSDPELSHIRLRQQVSGTLTDTRILNDTL